MSLAKTLLPEFDQEMANTRKVLEVVPDEKHDWKAGEGFRTIGWNANHVAEIPGWVELTIAEPAHDIAPVGGEPYQTPSLSSREEILAAFDRDVAAARAALEKATDEQMSQPWSLLQGGQTLMTMPRYDALRTFIFNHIIHHRAHLIVYLRLNGIDVPKMYGG